MKSGTYRGGLILKSDDPKVTRLRVAFATSKKRSSKRAELLVELKAAVNKSLRRELRAARKAKREKE